VELVEDRVQLYW